MKLRGILEAVAGALLAFLAVVLVWRLAGPNNTGLAATVQNGGVPRARDFTATSLMGADKVKLSDYAGRLIVLNFWASWCGPCKDEAAGFERAARRWRGTIVTFLGVDVHDATADARSFVSHYHLSYPVVHDGSETAVDLYGVSALPATFVIAPDGKVVDYVGGFAGEHELNARIAKALRRAGAA
jgi:cytochrome c biogenesis protein CcmG/thiol:disulfide interchange protein DsbE